MLKNQLITPEGTKDYLFEEAAARRKVETALCGLFEGRGFCEVITPGLEFLDVFRAKGHSLPEEEMYQLSDHKGRAMALRPDTTMPIARLCATRLKGSGFPVRLYYNQPVYLVNRSLNGRSDEVMQAGVELVGLSGEESELEILSMAGGVLDLCGLGWRLELGHIGIFHALMDALALDSEDRERLRLTIEGKNFPALGDILDPLAERPEADVIRRLPQLFGGEGVFAEAETLLRDEAALAALRDLHAVYEKLKKLGLGQNITVDLGLVNRADYYTGIVFKGYVEGSGEEVLSGGRYDNLLRKFGADAPAIGFAVNVDAAARIALAEERSARSGGKRPLRIALTKGRLEKGTIGLFEQIGLNCAQLHDKGRRLVLPIPDAGLEVVLAKAADVLTYVEHGVCDMGVVGKDTILENGGSFFEVADLGLGECRFALAAKQGADFYAGYHEKTVATKYPGVARRFFERKGMDVRIVKIEGSVELAPILGLADGIVDIVETGATLRENGLELVEEIAPVSARLIVNTVSLKLNQERMEALIRRLGGAAGNPASRSGFAERKHAK